MTEVGIDLWISTSSNPWQARLSSSLELLNWRADKYISAVTTSTCWTIVYLLRSFLNRVKHFHKVSVYTLWIRIRSGSLILWFLISLLSLLLFDSSASPLVMSWSHLINSKYSEDQTELLVVCVFVSYTFYWFTSIEYNWKKML